MHTAKPRMVVPYGLKTLLEGVSRAVLKASPPNITEFAAVYFRELILFREEHSEMDIKDLVREFHATRDKVLDIHFQKTSPHWSFQQGRESFASLFL